MPARCFDPLQNGSSLATGLCDATGRATRDLSAPLPRLSRHVRTRTRRLGREQSMAAKSLQWDQWRALPEPERVLHEHDSPAPLSKEATVSRGPLRLQPEPAGVGVLQRD